MYLFRKGIGRFPKWALKKFWCYDDAFMTSLFRRTQSETKNKLFKIAVGFEFIVSYFVPINFYNIKLSSCHKSVE